VTILAVGILEDLGALFSDDAMDLNIEDLSDFMDDRVVFFCLELIPTDPEVFHMFGIFDCWGNGADETERYARFSPPKADQVTSWSLG
jgi:hypothetical protein